MTEEIESELLKEYPQLPVARQNEGEITVKSCKHVIVFTSSVSRVMVSELAQHNYKL